MEYRVEDMETNGRETLQADFDAFDISEELGFLLEEPLVSFTVIFSRSAVFSSAIYCIYIKADLENWRMSYSVYIVKTEFCLSVSSSP